MSVYIDGAFLAGTFDNALVQVRVEDFREDCEYVEAHGWIISYKLFVRKRR